MILGKMRIVCVNEVYILLNIGDKRFEYSLFFGQVQIWGVD